MLNLAAARKVRQGKLPHVPPTASPLGTQVELVLDVPDTAIPEAFITDTRRSLAWRTGMTYDPVRRVWTAPLLLPTQPTVLTYHFILANGTRIQERRQAEGVIKPLFGEWEEKDFRIAAYDLQGVPPAWVRGQVLYQIFPDRFAVGDPASLHKKGQAEKVYGLDPIYKGWDEKPEHPPQSRDFFGGDLRGVINKLDYLHTLGVTCIYFTPIFESPSNHRYDALDYFKIDPRLGNEEDLRELVREAHKRGVRVMLDLVLNHCSSESAMFKSAQQAKTSSWYRMFEFHDWPHYDGWLKVKSMPEFVECPEMEDFFFGPNGVAQYWLKTGIAGFRTDVTPWITEACWRRFFKALRAVKPNVYLIAEDWGDNTSRFTGDQFDASMNYRFGYTVLVWANGHLNPSELDDRLETIRRDYAPPFLHAQMNLLGSHDTARLLTMCNGDTTRLKMAVALLLGYPGVPMIFAGDEAGCEGDYAEAARVPFPWDTPNTELIQFYRTALHARRNSAALSTGDVETVWINDDHRSYGFKRIFEQDSAYVFLNEGNIPSEVVVEHVTLGIWCDVLGSNAVVSVAQDQVLRVTIPAKSGLWFTRQAAC